MFVLYTAVVLFFMFLHVVVQISQEADSNPLRTLYPETASAVGGAAPPGTNPLPLVAQPGRRSSTTGAAAAGPFSNFFSPAEWPSFVCLVTVGLMVHLIFCSVAFAVDDAPFLEDLHPQAESLEILKKAPSTYSYEFPPPTVREVPSMPTEPKAVGVMAEAPRDFRTHVAATLAQAKVCLLSNFSTSSRLTIQTLLTLGFCSASRCMECLRTLWQTCLHRRLSESEWSTCLRPRTWMMWAC